MMTQTIPVSQARQRFGELINQVYKRQVRVIVEKSGIPVIALVSLSDLERWLHQELELKPMGQETSTARPPTKEELARREALVAKILKLREETNIAPLTTADLIHQTREEREHDYARWSH